MRLELFWQKLIDTPPLPLWWRIPLSILAICYTVLLRLRHFYWDHIKTPKKAPLPLICIGSPYAGGMGKTPFTLFLISELELYFQSETMAIISRGYKSQSERSSQPQILPKTAPTPLLASQFGDEPILMNHSHKGPVIVCKDRYRAACLAKTQGATLAILDDAMQHRALQYDWLIELVDGDVWKGHLHKLLPRGRLRDLPERINLADLVVSWNTPIATSRPQICLQYILEGFYHLDGTPVAKFIGPIALVAGLARPERLIKQLSVYGFDCVGTLFSIDHELPTESELKRFSSEAKASGAAWIVCTEKDAVKWPPITLSLPVAIMKSTIQCTKETQSILQNFVRQIAANCKKKPNVI